MKRALTIAAALAHRPSLVLLDEPITGLDVMHARKVCQMIAGLKEEGVTVFLTTHYEVIRSTLIGTPFHAGMADLAVLAECTAVLCALAGRILERQEIEAALCAHGSRIP